MNRVIKFRGKRCKDGEWVYGSYVESYTSWRKGHPHKSWILPSPMTNGGWFSIKAAFAVIEETVGQSAGIKDTNGTIIYEGDIIKITYNTHREIQNSCRYVVCFGEWVYSDDEYCDVLHNGWYLKRLDKTLPRICQPSEISFQDEVESNYIRIEIIGNIYDDKHLLEGGQCD